MRWGFWVFVFACALFIESVHAQGVRTDNNYTAEYLEALQRPTRELDEAVIRYKDHTFIFIPGFLSDFFTHASRTWIFQNLGLPKYFDDQMNYLTMKGIKNIRVKIESEDIPQANAERILDVFRQVEGKMVIVAHSKGVVDFLQALVWEPEYAKRIDRAIFLQGAVYGSHVADCVEDRLPRTIGWILRLIGGTPKSLTSLRTNERARWMADHAAEVDDIVRSIPTLTFESWIGEKPWQINTTLFAGRNIILKKGLRSDGLVPFGYGRLRSPHEYLITVPGVDHADPVMPSYFRRFDRVKQLKALCAMTVNQLASSTIVRE